MAAFPSLGITCSPSRNVFSVYQSPFQPFGGSTAKNILESFLGTPEIVTSVLYLGCGDLRNALHTLCHMTKAYPELDAHLSDNSDVNLTRNYVIAHIVLSENFDPAVLTNIDYIWDIWYSTQWNDTTRKRFLKDVKQLSSLRMWGTETLKIPDGSKAVEHMKKLCRTWLNSASNMSVNSVKNILDQRLNHISEMAQLHEDITDRWGSASLPKNASLPEIVSAVRRRILMQSRFGNLRPSSLENEVEIFIQTGNCEPIVDKTVCINPTFLTAENEVWGGVDYLATPFEAYFPVSIDEQLASDCLFDPAKENNAVGYSKAKLQSLITLFRSRASRVVLHFHFGDCLELCLMNQTLQNKFQVVHSSHLADRVGLANVLLAASLCLAKETPEAILLTDVTSWRDMKRAEVTEFVRSVADYIELSLCCPLSMIPTLFGVRLMNHVKLGSLECIKLHDLISVNPVTLKWRNGPSYSDNIKLAISIGMKIALNSLAESCFVLDIVNDLHGSSAVLPNTPVTFYYLLRTLVCRFQWVPGAIESFIQQIVVSPWFQLEFRTQQQWMKGQPVLLYSSSSPLLLQNDFLEGRDFPVLLLLVSKKEMKRFGAKPGSTPPREFFTQAHVIENLYWSKVKSAFSRNGTNSRLFSEQSFSLLLAQDHGLDTSTQLCIIQSLSCRLLYSTEFFPLFQSKTVLNPSPLLCQSAGAVKQETGEADEALNVLKCLEFENRYSLDISIQQGYDIDDINDVFVSSEVIHPSISTHQVSLTLPDFSPLIFKVPWPVLAEKIKLTLGQGQTIHVVMQKSLNDAWPNEFGGRSKWDPDRLKRWQDLDSGTVGTLKMHVQAQFNCDDLFLEKRFWSDNEAPVLNGVREIVRALFYSHCHNSLFLFAIYDDRKPNKPVFHLRIHSVRCTPQMSPLLLLSVIDHHLAEQLMEQQKLEAEQNNFDFHRLITERVSREVCAIRVSSTEEVDLFRYLLRVNSTRMRRGAWQSKNLPRGESSPFMATFVSPVYQEDLSDVCATFADHYYRTAPPDVAMNVCGPLYPFYRNCCVTCAVKLVKLSDCGRCKAVSYCSVACQKKHWSHHKSRCFYREHRLMKETVPAY